MYVEEKNNTCEMLKRRVKSRIIQNEGTWPSWRPQSMDSTDCEVGTGEKVDREPMMADLILHLSQCSGSAVKSALLLCQERRQPLVDSGRSGTRASSS